MNARKWILILLVVIPSLIGLAWYFGLPGFLLGLSWGSIVTILTNLDRVADVLASSYKLGRRAHFWFEKNAVEKRLEVTISSASKKVNTEAGFDVLPHGIDSKWAEPQDREAFLKKGNIIVCLESSYNEERNLARATMLYVQEDLIYESQRFVNATVMKSLVFAMARKLLMLDRKLGALRCLNKEFMEPEVKKIPQIRKYLSGMDSMDKDGLLTRLLLREFSKLDARLSPALTDPQSRKETKSFTKMLKHFAERTKGEQVPALVHRGGVFQVGLLPVAKLERFHISKFLKAVHQYHDENVNTIYVLARGMNVILAKHVISEIEKSNLYVKNKDWEYTIVGRVKRRLNVYTGELSRV